MSKFIIEMKGFKPTKDLMQFVREKMNRITSESPDLSYISLLLRKNQQLYIGELTVNSSAQSFHSENSNAEVAEVAICLVESIERQLRTWKSLRFLPV